MSPPLLILVLPNDNLDFPELMDEYRLLSFFFLCKLPFTLSRKNDGMMTDFDSASSNLAPQSSPSMPLSLALLLFKERKLLIGGAATTERASTACLDHQQVDV